MQLTEEQNEIMDAFERDRKNMIIRARAGAAKTTTLRLLVDAYKRPSLYLAFNKSVVTEARDKLHPRCRIMTLNGIGHQTLAKASPHKLTLDTRKMFKILKELGYKGKDFAEVLRATRLSKHHGFIPNHARSLLSKDDFFKQIDMSFSAHAQDTICTAIARSFTLATSSGIIDFDDQIIIPTIGRMVFPYAPTVFIDEAQDLSTINRAMLRCIIGIGSRLVAVGDDAQAIYGFRGADHESMDNLQETFKMEPYKLTMTFRCSRRVTQHANWRTHDMRHTLDAPMGGVHYMDYINYKDMLAGTAILCRNNAPLVRLTLRMINAGMAPTYLGNDILDELLRTFKKITKSTTTAEHAHDAINLWSEEKQRTWKSSSVVEDKAECMRAFLHNTTTAGEAIARIEHIRALHGDDIILSTIHKSKGAEYDNVIILDKHLIRQGHEQEDNLLYVAQTRARHFLYYCRQENIGDVRPSRDALKSS